MRALFVVTVMAAMACSGTGGTGGTGGGSSSAGGTGGTGGSSGGSGDGGTGGNMAATVNVTGAVTTNVTVTPLAAYQASSGLTGVSFNSPSTGRYSLFYAYTVTGKLTTGTFASGSTLGFTCSGDFVDTDGGTHWTWARATQLDGGLIDGGSGTCQLQLSSVAAYNVSAIGEAYTVHGTATVTASDLAGDGGTVNLNVTF
ncbi:MAG: hypothetical protein JNK82_13805 [Myxococcaceae bacterium]|nr:hypothetical protein [Myxococcaceae bacterium]